MVDLLILFINIIYLITGILQYYLAPKIGPNPYFGFKIGYTFADREVWNKTNRLMGKFVIIHSLLLFPTALIPDFMLYYLLLFIIPLVAFIPFGIRYAAILLEMKSSKSEIASKRKMEPITVGLLWSLSPLIFYLVLIAVEMITYPSLPDVIAVHFDLSGNPNGWSSKSSFILSYSLFALFAPAFSYIFIYLGKKYPMYIHPGKMRFSSDTFLKTTILSMDITSIILILVYYTIYIYAVEKLVVPWPWFMIVTIILILVPIGYLAYKWRR